MVTIAFGFVVEYGVVEWQGLTGGQNGMMNIPYPAVGAGRWASVACRLRRSP